MLVVSIATVAVLHAAIRVVRSMSPVVCRLESLIEVHLLCFVLLIHLLLLKMLLVLLAPALPRRLAGLQSDRLPPRPSHSSFFAIFFFLFGKNQNQTTCTY
jgi:hypothetical protein